MSSTTSTGRLAEVEAPGRSTAGAELSLLIGSPIARYLARHQGAQSVAEVAAAAGLRAEDLTEGRRWVSLATLEALLAAARARLADDTEFKVACAYEMRRAIGPLRAVLWATSPERIHLLAATGVTHFSRISRYEVISSSPTSLEIRYLSEKAESRLMCLSRQAQGAAITTLWDLPPAQLREGKCIAHGDDACEYRWRFYRPWHWAPAALGLAVGAAGAAAAATTGVMSGPALVAVPLVGLALGTCVEQWRRLRQNQRVGMDIIADLRDAALEAARIREELVELQQRERRWNRLVEEQLAEKTGLLQELVEGLQGAEQRRASVLRGFSHDLRNPLQVIRANVAALRDSGEFGGEELARILEEQSAAAERLEQLTGMLIAAAATDGPAVELRPQRIAIPPLVDKLRRRLAALAYGKRLRTMVFPTREAPETVEMDALVLDRVLDNLFTNAVKYTERGSIAVEIGGTPGHLTIKLSDTGVGIEPAQLERIFQPGGSRRSDRAPGSHGLGLSVVVSLLHQVGGRLEVLSKPGVGTTFWVHFPEKLRPPSDAGHQEPTQVLSRVVRIRRPATG